MNEDTPFRYKELADRLRERIAKLPSGSRLPSIRSLIKRYDVSLPTVNSALRILENEALLVRRRGSGIFVGDANPAKLIMFHRSLHPSIILDQKEESLMAALTKEGWHFHVNRYSATHDVIPEDLNLRANAHVVTDELINIQTGILPPLQRQNVPVVVIDREMQDAGTDYVRGNDLQTITLLVKHFYHLGHTRLALLVNEPSSVWSVAFRIRFLGEVMSILDLPKATIIDCQTQSGEDSAVKAYMGLHRYLEKTGKNPPFTALLVMSSAGGPGALRAFHENGISVPQDCSVATLGLEQNNFYLIPSLTCAGDAPRDYGEWIVKLLKQRFAGNTTPSLGFQLPSEFFPLESTSQAPVRNV